MDEAEGRARQHRLRKRSAWLTTHTVDDLRARLESDDEYVLLGLAGVLRRCFMDEKPLAEMERRRLQLPALEFTYRPAPVRPSSSPLATQVRFPTLGRFREPVEVGSTVQFLRAAVASAQGDAISVGHLIRHFAHVEGGVHVGHPSDASEEALGAIFGFRTDGWRHGLGILADIAFVAAEGMAPLVHLPQSSTVR